MRRFFFRPEERTGDKVSLDEAESRHVKTVLRLQPGDGLELLDGSGTIYTAEIVNVEKRVCAEITGSKIINEGETTSLIVCQGLLKAKKMDSVIQKCTELGVMQFIPFISSRCQGRPDGRQLRKKHERWFRIIEESCKQCCRPRKMELIEPVGFGNIVQTGNREVREMKLLFWEEEKSMHLHDVGPLTGVERITILLGPEGGFSREEIETSRKEGWKTVSLGKRILRAETATYASVAILQHLLGHM